MSFKRRLALTKMNFWCVTSNLLEILYEWSMSNWEVAIKKGRKLI